MGDIYQNYSALCAKNRMEWGKKTLPNVGSIKKIITRRPKE